MRYLLLHAFPFDATMWDDVAETLRSAGHDVSTPDLRGFGSHPLGGDAPDLDRMVEDVELLLGEEPAIVAGCSMGGYVALGLTRRRPGLVEALALVDTKATADSQAARDNRERVAMLAESGGDWSAGMIDNLLGVTTRKTRPDVVARVEGVLRSAPRQTIAWAQRAMSGRSDARETLAGIACPVLVVVGEEDTVSPMEEQALILAAAPAAGLVVIPGAGHLTPLESPATVAAALGRLATPTR